MIMLARTNPSPMMRGHLTIVNRSPTKIVVRLGGIEGSPYWTEEPILSGETYNFHDMHAIGQGLCTVSVRLYADLYNNSSLTWKTKRIHDGKVDTSLDTSCYEILYSNGVGTAYLNSRDQVIRVIEVRVNENGDWELVDVTERRAGWTEKEHLLYRLPHDQLPREYKMEISRLSSGLSTKASQTVGQETSHTAERSAMAQVPQPQKQLEVHEDVRSNTDTRQKRKDLSVISTLIGLPFIITIFCSTIVLGLLFGLAVSVGVGLFSVVFRMVWLIVRNNQRRKPPPGRNNANALALSKVEAHQELHDGIRQRVPGAPDTVPNQPPEVKINEQSAAVIVIKSASLLVFFSVAWVLESGLQWYIGGDRSLWLTGLAAYLTYRCLGRVCEEKLTWFSLMIANKILNNN